jgi:UDP-2-acetamido-2,6-beta-L-arabino-hexul-4-ose reductase
LIIGNGLIANSFKERYKDDDKVLIFASGVSNSNEQSIDQFNREEILLKEALQSNPSSTFVYFSSCDVLNEQKRKYFIHKLNMEALVKKGAKTFNIIRLPQVVGSTTNKNTIINFLINKIKSSSEFIVWKNVSRNFIDVDDVVAIVDYLIGHSIYPNKVSNVASTVQYPILDVITILENFLNKKADYAIENSEFNLLVDVDPLAFVFSELNITFEGGYLLKLLHKYYT